MSTVVYSSYNQYPGATSQYLSLLGVSSTGYNFATGMQPPLLPAVNLYNNFSFEVKSRPGIDFTPTTAVGGVDQNTSFASTGVRRGITSATPSYGTSGSTYPRVYRKPVAMRWIRTNGPNGNGICRNERGDWFSEEVLETADDQGNGVRFTDVPAASATENVTIGFEQSVATPTTTSSTLPLTAIVPSWNSLRISGSYNGAVFCYNTFEYTNDDVGTIYTARSLFEIPNRIDNLVTFIPDQRSSTTLTFFIEVDWIRYVSWGIYGSLISSGDQSSILATYDSNGFPASGTDVHEITHVVNNNNPNWGRILRDIIEDRQRTIQEQDERYGNSFPTKTLGVS